MHITRGNVVLYTPFCQNLCSGLTTRALNVPDIMRFWFFTGPKPNGKDANTTEGDAGKPSPEGRSACQSAVAHTP